MDISLKNEEGDLIKELLKSSPPPHGEYLSKIVKKMKLASEKASERNGCILNMEDAAQYLFQVNSETVP